MWFWIVHRRGVHFARATLRRIRRPRHGRVSLHAAI